VSEPAGPETPDPEARWPGPPRVVLPHVFDRRPADAPTLRAATEPLLPLFVIDVLTAFTVGMLPPLLPLVVADFALSTAEAGLVNTVYAVGRLVGSYPASLVRARWGTRFTVLIGLAGLIGGTFGCAVVPTFAGFLVGRAVMGLGSAAAFLAVFAELLESTPGNWRGRLANLFEGVAITSVAVGGVLAAVLAQRTGWRTAFAAAAVVMLACIFSARRLASGASRRDTEPAAGQPPLLALDRRALAPICAASAALTMMWSGVFATMVPLLGHDGYGLGAAALGLAMAAGYAAELAGLVVVGFVIDRVRREPLFVGGAVAVLAGGLLLAVGARPATFVVALVLMGGGFAVWMIPATVLADRAGTPIPPTSLAIFRASVDAGMIIGPIALAGLAGMVGERPSVGAAGLVLLAAALYLARGPRGPGASR
jgi:MFS family permease